ncbi:MAG: polyphosphate polymerase domain-containing protein [Butyricicoccus sp.]
MTAVQTTFARVEKKYIVPERSYRALCEALAEYLVPDQFGAYTICNIYYDTPDYRLIRASLDKPVYKEKLRLRSYGVPGESDSVFVELKKKFDGVVYKRRTALPLAQARTWLNSGVHPLTNDQIGHEIDWFLQFYRPQPAVFLAYDRIAYTCPSVDGLRLTFDSRLRWREDALDLAAGDHGTLLTAPGDRILEIKIPGAVPLWLSEILDRFAIYPSSFSKYGTYYQQQILQHPDTKGAIFCA